MKFLGIFSLFLFFVQRHDYIDDNSLCFAAYVDHLVLGQVTVNNDSQTIFDEFKSLSLGQNSFFNLIHSLKKAKNFFEHHRDEHFQMDLYSTKTKRPPLYKLSATFGKYGEATDPIFQIRTMWRYGADTGYLKRLKKGMCEEIKTDSEYIFTKRGIVLDCDAVDLILEVLEEYILATYSGYGEPSTRLVKIANFAKEHMIEDLDKKIALFPMMKSKDKVEFIDSVLSKMKNHDSDFFEGDDFNMNQAREMLLAKSYLLFCVLNIRSGCLLN